jgi:hypothetical protein
VGVAYQAGGSLQATPFLILFNFFSLSFPFLFFKK